MYENTHLTPLTIVGAREEGRLRQGFSVFGATPLSGPMKSETAMSRQEEGSQDSRRSKLEQQEDCLGTMGQTGVCKDLTF